MKLNRESRDKKRKRIDTKLSDVEFNPDNRIKLPKEELEELLFEIKKDSKGKIYKELAFVGDNLCKLDLSKVNFYEVSYDSAFSINLSNINADIDFSKSYEAMNNKPLVVTNINFKNTDLSLCDLEHSAVGRATTATFKCCDLSNTKLGLSGTIFADFIACNLTNLDLGDLNLSIDGCDEYQRLKINDEFDEILFVGCNLSRTNASIKCPSFLAPEVKTALRLSLKRKQLDKCALLEVKGEESIRHIVKTKAQKIALKNKILKEYAVFEANNINETLDMIDAQLSSFGGRQVPVKKQTLKPTTPTDAGGMID